MSYLSELLRSQTVEPPILDALRARREATERLLRGGWDCEPRFYYGGSFGKRTMIAAEFDLDLVMYFPPETELTPEGLFEAVERRLTAAGHAPARHNVALRLRYTPGWHVDVVPGRALDQSYYFADLWASEPRAPRRTSLKRHIEEARGADREALRILKLWKRRNLVPVGSFALELVVARVLRGCAGHELESRVERVLRFLANEFEEARLVDPANGSNVVSEDLRWAEKRAVAGAARRSLGETCWERVVW